MTQETDNNVIDVSAMSDEELMNLDLNTLANQDSENQTNDSKVNHVEQQPENMETVPTENNNTQVNEVQTQEDNSNDETGSLDYEEFYKKLTSPFKANGKEITVSNPDDMIRLMQQGANYSKKMEELKPSTAMVNMLKKHELDDVEKLSYLIDLYQKKPEAIAKLIQESEIDLYTFDTDQANDYVPSQLTVEENPLEVALDNLKNTSSTYTQTVDYLSGWDDASKQVLWEKPELLSIIDGQVQNGQYQRINDIIEYERMLGRMTNIPYLQAYSIVEQSLNSNPQQNTFVGSRPNHINDNNPQRMKATNPSAGKSNQATNINPLSIPDDELDKFLAQQLR